jgi:hypothetical protein
MKIKKSMLSQKADHASANPPVRVPVLPPGNQGGIMVAMLALVPPCARQGPAQKIKKGVKNEKGKRGDYIHLLFKNDTTGKDYDRA